MIKDRADAFGCLAIAFIAASIGSFLLFGLGMMADIPHDGPSPPVLLWRAAAIVMPVPFIGALAVATLMAGRPYSVPVLVGGSFAAVSLYVVVVGALWWSGI